MLKAKKANRVVRIDDTKADEYRALGYTIMDMDNKILMTPNNDKFRIQALEQENARLRAQLSAQRAETGGRGKKTGKGRK